MADVFISYHMGGRASSLVNRIRSELWIRWHVTCWCADADIMGGDNYPNIIPEAIQNCKIFLLILDKDSAHSKHVENEVALAFKRYKSGEYIAIIPIQPEECQLSRAIIYYTATTQIIRWPYNYEWDYWVRCVEECIKRQLDKVEYRKYQDYERMRLRKRKQLEQITECRKEQEQLEKRERQKGFLMVLIIIGIVWLFFSILK